MRKAIDACNTRRPKLQPLAEAKNNKHCYENVAPHIKLIDNTIKLYGAGMESVGEETRSSNEGEIPTTAPMAPFNDVRNGPYFVTRGINYQIIIL